MDLFRREAGTYALCGFKNAGYCSGMRYREGATQRDSPLGAGNEENAKGTAGLNTEKKKRGFSAFCKNFSSERRTKGGVAQYAQGKLAWSAQGVGAKQKRTERRNGLHLLSSPGKKSGGGVLGSNRARFGCRFFFALLREGGKRHLLWKILIMANREKEKEKGKSQKKRGS